MDEPIMLHEDEEGTLTQETIVVEQGPRLWTYVSEVSWICYDRCTINYYFVEIDVQYVFYVKTIAQRVPFVMLLYFFIM